MTSSFKTRKSFSWTAKANHSQIVNDDYIKSFLKGCRFPKKPSLDDEKSKELIKKIPSKDISKKHILTVDGSYTLVQTQKEFPSSEIAFFQFGAIAFETDDLDNLSKKPFIAPEDIKKLHNLQKAKLAIPVKNVTSNNQKSLNESIRNEIYRFFLNEKDTQLSLMDTLCWLIFEEYSDMPKTEYPLASDPNIGATKGEVLLRKNQMKPNFTFEHNGNIIYLTDVFRLHEVIDEDFGAAGILGYISRLVEQILLMRYVQFIYKQGPAALNDFIFISNGPLSFSGQTANMHKPFRSVCNFLGGKININFLGLEKSGPFVDHAFEICKNEESKFYLKKGSVLILSNEYIYKYIVPGDHERMHYGKTSYYGGKIIIHTDDDQVFVVSLPTENSDVILSPKSDSYKNIELVVSVLKRLKCDMFSDTIIPIALANKLIALTGHPSQSILEKFARKSSLSQS